MGSVLGEGQQLEIEKAYKIAINLYAFLLIHQCFIRITNLMAK